MHELTETEIQASILEFLHYKKIFAWRNNNNAVYDKATGTYRKPGKYSIAGVPDILGVLPDGKLLAIEVKRNKRNTPTVDQKKFIRKARRAGGVAFVAWSVEQVEKRLSKYF